jgi:protein disulfide-isomerase-like protein
VDGSKNVFIKFFAPWCGHCKAMVGAYDEIAEAFSKESQVVIADVDADAHKELATRFGVSGFPTLKFFKKGSTEPVDYSGGREAADIIEFINKEAGTRARIAKAASAVTVLSADNFDGIVLDTTKDVFVEFYAPWCGHCKRLTPIWEKLSSVFKNEPNLVIANLDADANKDLATKYGVSGFPTLIYFSKTDKVGDRYAGGRELPELVAHVNTKAGSNRLESGRLAESVGRDPALDELAHKFMTNPSERTALVAQAEALAAQSSHKHGEWYSKFMSVIIKKGDDWVAKEQERVKGMLDGGNLSGEKVDEFTIRTNVLNAFQ